MTSHYSSDNTLIPDNPENLGSAIADSPGPLLRARPPSARGRVLKFAICFSRHSGWYLCARLWQSLTLPRCAPVGGLITVPFTGCQIHLGVSAVCIKLRMVRECDQSLGLRTWARRAGRSYAWHLWVTKPKALASVDPCCIRFGLLHVFGCHHRWLSVTCHRGSALNGLIILFCTHNWALAPSLRGGLGVVGVRPKRHKRTSLGHSHLL